MWDWDGHMGGGWWVVMMIFWLVVLAAVVWGVVQIANNSGREPTSGERQPPVESPREELDRRLARGEIDVDTYDVLRERIDRRTPEHPVPG